MITIFLGNRLTPMRKKLFLSYVPILLFITSCGGFRLVPREPSEGEMTVSRHIDNQDIEALIRDHFNYPEESKSIENYLASNVEYDDYSYSNLARFLFCSQGDSVMTSFFQGIVDDRQEFVLDYIADCSYEEMGDYYRSHTDEHEFLRSFLEDAIFPELDNADYVLTRHLHRAFANTDLSPHIDKIWMERRSVLLPDVESALKSYYKKEGQLETFYRACVFEEVRAYVDGVFPEMMETCLNEVENGMLDLILVRLRKTDEPFADRVERIVQRYIPDYMIEDKLFSALSSLVRDVNESRTELAVSLVLDEDIPLTPFTIAKSQVSYSGPVIPKEIPNMIEEMVETTRKNQNLLSVGSTLLSFIPGVGWGLKAAKAAVDGADLLYGISSTMDEQQKVNEFIQSFSEVLYETEMNQVEQQFNQSFDLAKSLLEASRVSYKNEIQEAL